MLRTKNSRYELQQAVLLNPNGLVVNTTNRFGSVDSSNNISVLKIVSHPEIGGEVANGILANQPLFVPDFFGTGIHSYSTAPDKTLVKVEPLFLKDWDEEWFFALKIEHKTPISTNVRLISVRDFAYTATEFYINISNVGVVDINLTTTTPSNTNLSRKLIRLTNPLVDGDVLNLIFYCSGTNDSNDYEVYKNGATESFTSILNQDFTGNTLYPVGITTDVRLSIGSRAGGISSVHQGKFGKIIYGYGSPNVQAIEDSLNSAI